MKYVLEGLVNSFSMYSRIPMPKTAWSKEGMRYMLCFFPLVGMVIAFLLLVWQALCGRLGFSPVLFGAGAALLPVAVSGGIHMDGLMDAADALGGGGDSRRRQEIMRDSHTGAFGVLYCAGYLLVCMGMWCQVYPFPRMVALACSGVVVSRIANALSIVLLPSAPESGLVKFFSDSAARKKVVGACFLFWVGATIFQLWVSPAWGLAGAVGTVLCYVWHSRLCRLKFGGNSGDLAGWLLQKTELLWLAAAVLGSVV